MCDCRGCRVRYFPLVARRLQAKRDAAWRAAFEARYPNDYAAGTKADVWEVEITPSRFGAITLWPRDPKGA
jgi:hypothetical protein